LRVEYAKKVLQEMKNSGYTATALMLLNLSLAYALRGDILNSTKMLSKVDTTEQSTSAAGNNMPTKHSQQLFEEQQMEDIKAVAAMLKRYLYNFAKVKPQKYESILNSPQVKFIQVKHPALDFPSMFNKISPLPKMTRALVKLEVCAGSGEWVVARAKAEPATNWIALDIRFDRVFQTWSKVVLNNLSNLVILKGDAVTVFTDCVSEGSLDEVMVNFPEPPAIEGSQQHLLTVDYLKLVYRALKTRGTLTIVTDNTLYANVLRKEFKQLEPQFESAFEQHFEQTIPADYGSSYFDRFWTRGSKTQRFFFKYYKK